MATTMQQHTYLRTAGSLDILLGIWLIISPFLLGFNELTGALWNAIISGLAIIVLAATQTAQSDKNVSWPSWVNLIIGIWLVLAPFAMVHSVTATWNSIISGIVVIGLAAWAAFSSTPMDRFEDKI